LKRNSDAKRLFRRFGAKVSLKSELSRSSHADAGLTSTSRFDAQSKSDVNKAGRRAHGAALRRSASTGARECLEGIRRGNKPAHSVTNCNLRASYLSPVFRDSLAQAIIPMAYFQPEGCFCRFKLRLKGREMKNRISVSEVGAKLGYPSSETVQGLRLWKAFIKLSPAQRSEVLALVEQLATDPAPVPGGMNGRFSPR
jgi:hypothetical protein